MNKNERTLIRRRNDLIKAIEQSKGKRVGDVINTFASKHYLSESTVWKDYERALDERTNTRSNGRGSKHH